MHSNSSSNSSDAIMIGVATMILLAAALWLWATLDVEFGDFLVDAMSRFGPGGLRSLG